MVQASHEFSQPFPSLPGFIKAETQFWHDSEDMLLGQLLFNKARGFL